MTDRYVLTQELGLSISSGTAVVAGRKPAGHIVTLNARRRQVVVWIRPQRDDLTHIPDMTNSPRWGATAFSRQLI